jgi:hypothetical protein
LSTVPITADKTGDRDCAGLFLAFCFFAAMRILLGQVLRPDPDVSRRLCFPIVGRTMSRRRGEVLKADGKPKMTLCDGLQIGRRDRHAAASRRAKARTVRMVRWRVARDQPTRIAGAPARVPGTCLTVVTTAKMTATAKAIEKAANTKRGTI